MGRTYLELCNAILEELFYETVDSFDDLEGITEGLKVKRMLNNVLRQICNNETTKWKFREVDKVIALCPYLQEYDMPNGYIRYMRYIEPPIVLKYLEDHDSLAYKVNGLPTSYWICNNKIKLYPVPSENEANKPVIVKYNTYDYAITECGVYVPEMVNETDQPIIPDHHRDVMIWKVCADWRANVNDSKTAFYQGKYNTAYKALLDDQKLSKNYPNKIDIMPNRYSWQDGVLDAFYNPRTRKIL